MKRFILPAVLLILLGGLAHAQQTGSPCCGKQACCANAETQYNNELLDILRTTHSVDTFVVTLNLLVDTDVEPRMAIPLIIRNAERLGVFAETLQEEDEEKPSSLVIEVIGTLKERIHVHHPAVGAAVGCTQKAASGASCGACEDHCCNRETTATKNDSNTPLLPPLRPGKAQDCDTTPSDAEVLHALHLKDVAVDDVTIVKNKVLDKVDAPRFYPLVGVAQLHHCHWECTVTYKETITATSYPVTVTHARLAVIYIDKDHLHLCPPTPEKHDDNEGFDPNLYDLEGPSNHH